MVMGTLATILGAAGAVLLLVGLVGGGFSFSGAVMPKDSKVSRVLCFAIGGVLLVTSLRLVATDAATEPAVAGETPASPSPNDASPPPPPPASPTPLPAPPAEPSVGHVYVGV